MMKLGVDYYPEHWPENNWAKDARLMRAAGLNVVRMAEFAWSRLEPREGQFEFDWLDRAVQTLAEAGLQVILGTPTAAPPHWLVRKYPEVLQRDAAGQLHLVGGRAACCANSPLYHEKTEQIVRRLAERYAAQRGVIGWQVDNEFGRQAAARCYCPSCTVAFRHWLEIRYGSLQQLNEAWGAVYWSQEYSDWAEIEPPVQVAAGANPGATLDFYRFSTAAWVNYEQFQVDLLRKYSPGKPVTHNFAGGLAELDVQALARPLDWVSCNSYPTGQAEQMADRGYEPGEARPAKLAFDVGDPYITGWCHDTVRGLKKMAFWVMEQQCGQTNRAEYNTTVRSNTVRLWTWHALASGAEGVLYFNFRSGRFAQGQMQAGLLHPDGSPAVGYHDLISMLPERDLMDAVAAQPHVARVAILSDPGDFWALQLQPQRKHFSYQRSQFRFWQALQRLGIECDIVSPQVDLSAYRLVISPHAHLVDAFLAADLRAYVENGGTLLLGVRSGFKTPNNVIIDQPLPGLLRGVAGVRVSEWQSLKPGIGYLLKSVVPGLAGKAETWVEALSPLRFEEQTEGSVNALATYGNGPLFPAAAFTENRLGKGSALYLGFYPSLEQVGAILRWLAERLEIEPAARMPEGVVAVRRGPYTVVLNFNDDPANVLVKGETLLVGPRDVEVVGQED